MQNSIYKIKYLLFLSWDWEACCLTQSGGRVIRPPPQRNTAWNKGRKCFHCLGAPNNLIRPCPQHSTAWTFTLAPACLYHNDHRFAPDSLQSISTDTRSARCYIPLLLYTFILFQTIKSAVKLFERHCFSCCVLAQSNVRQNNWLANHKLCGMHI